MKIKLNDLRAQRAGIIRKAEEIATKAETEKRDLTDAEITEIDNLVGTDDGSIPGQVSALDGQIARYVRIGGLVEDLANPAGKPPVKPEASSNPKVMKRVEYDKLDAAAQAAYVKSGGKVED